MPHFDTQDRRLAGEHLKFLAQKQGFTQHSLGQAVGLSASAISKVWRGITTKPTHYELLAAELSTTLDALTTPTESELPQAPEQPTAHRSKLLSTCHRVTVASRKGGTAKTTTTVHLAGTLARRGYRVLLVDLDAQMDATEWMLDPVEDADALTSCDVIRDGVDPAQVIRPGWIPGLDVMPAGFGLDGLARETAADYGVERQLMSLMKPLEARYDFIFYDTPAAFDIRTVNALMASSQVLIPSQPGPLDLKGLFNFLPQVLKFTDPQRFNPELELLGIVLCRVKNATVMLREATEFLGHEFGSLVCEHMISDSIRYQEVSGQQALIQEWEPRHAAEYNGLVNELLERLHITSTEHAALH
jgi:chromosome partitioning protein